MEPILNVEDINVYYGSIHAVKGVSFEVNQGEIVTLIGANGAGKSTTLNTISGLLHSKTGSVTFMGEDLGKVPSHKIVSKGLAMGRALMSHPSLLMLDEPSMGLAPILVEQIFDIIKDLHKAGTTILLVEQNAQAALSVADRGYVLETGRIVTSGTGHELLESPAIKKAYLGG